MKQKSIHRYERQLPVRLIRPPKPPVPSAKPGLSSVVAATELCYGCRRHLPRTAFPLSSGAVVGRCLSCARLDNAARSGHDLSAFKAMMERIKAAEEEENNTSSPVFQMQVEFLRSQSYLTLVGGDGLAVVSVSSCTPPRHALIKSPKKDNLHF